MGLQKASETKLDHPEKTKFEHVVQKRLVEFLKFFTCMVMNRLETYALVWDEIQSLGYEKNDDISYFEFIECCESVGVDGVDIDVEDFAEYFEINIG